MARNRSGPIDWYRPDPRALLPLDRFHTPKSLRRRLAKQPFIITGNRAFDQVIQACAAPRKSQPQTWINETIRRAYTRLHEAGFAHSVEAWSCPPGSAPERTSQSPCGDPTDRSTASTQNAPPPGDQLVGGLYGVAIGAAFFGESMFTTAPDASKICLVHLVDHLRQCRFTLLDVQFTNPHLQQFGAIEIPCQQYLQQLSQAIRQPPRWRDMNPLRISNDKQPPE